MAIRVRKRRCSKALASLGYAALGYAVHHLSQSTAAATAKLHPLCALRSRARERGGDTEHCVPSALLFCLQATANIRRRVHWPQPKPRLLCRQWVATSDAKQEFFWHCATMRQLASYALCGHVTVSSKSRAHIITTLAPSVLLAHAGALLVSDFRVVALRHSVRCAGIRLVQLQRSLFSIMLGWVQRRAAGDGLLVAHSQPALVGS